MYASLSPLQKKTKQHRWGMIHQTLSQDPRMRGKKASISCDEFHLHRCVWYFVLCWYVSSNEVWIQKINFISLKTCNWVQTRKKQNGRKKKGDDRKNGDSQAAFCQVFFFLDVSLLPPFSLALARRRAICFWCSLSISRSVIFIRKAWKVKKNRNA